MVNVYILHNSIPLVWFQATDPDLNDIIRYAIKPDTFTAIGNNLDAILGNPFELNPNNGALILNFAVSATMTGYISFEVQAFDLGIQHLFVIFFFFKP